MGCSGCPNGSGDESERSSKVLDGGHPQKEEDQGGHLFGIMNLSFVGKIPPSLSLPGMVRPALEIPDMGNQGITKRIIPGGFNQEEITKRIEDLKHTWPKAENSLSARPRKFHRISDNGIIRVTHETNEEMKHRAPGGGE